MVNVDLHILNYSFNCYSFYYMYKSHIMENVTWPNKYHEFARKMADKKAKESKPNWKQL